jgi:hypothetical protein
MESIPWKLPVEFRFVSFRAWMTTHNTAQAILDRFILYDPNVTHECM